MDKDKNTQGIKGLKSAELVSRLTKLEHDIEEIRMYDRHLGIESLNRYNKRSRKQRIVRMIKEASLYIMPYLIGVILILILMNLGG